MFGGSLALETTEDALNDVDIATVTETKFCDMTLPADVAIPGYIAVRRDRDDIGGGVAVWAKSDISVTQISQLDGLEHEIK